MIADYPHGMSKLAETNERTHEELLDQLECAEQDARRTRDLLTTVQNAQTHYLEESDMSVVFDRLLADALVLTDSTYGFIGEVLMDHDANSWLKTHATVHTALPGDGGARNWELRDLNTLFGSVLNSGQAVIANSSETGLADSGLPAFYPRPTGLLGLPLRYGNKLVGMIGVTNREGGYDARCVEYVQPFLTTCARLIHSYRSRRENELAEKALRASEQRFRRLADSAPVMIWQTGTDKLSRWFNRSWLEFTGCTSDEAMGNPWSRTVHPEDYPASRAVYLQAFHKREPFVAEYRLKRHDGEYRWIVDHGVPFEVEGQFFGYIGSCMDIQERMQAEEERREFENIIQHTQKLESLGMLAGGVAHDFNNALTSILGHASVAQMELPVDSPARPALAEISRAAEKASDLTRQMLAYSGKGKLEVQNLCLGEIVQDASRLLETLVSRKADINLGLDPAPAKGDPTKIRQVLMGLVTNAAESVEERGTIEIQTGVRPLSARELESDYVNLPPADRYAYVEIQDYGCGMSRETEQRIFDPFFTTKPERRGLGLAVVQGIVQSHGGGVLVDSKLGQGTTFTVFLPTTDAPDIDGSGADRQSAAPNTILVVEDEESVRTFVRRALELAGYSVQSAADGEEGIRQFKRHEVDIAAIILDWTMPRSNGQDMLGELGALNTKVPTLVISGYHDIEIEPLARTAGATAVLPKPFRAPELISIVKEMLG